jgi:hypothetical protein
MMCARALVARLIRADFLFITFTFDSGQQL